jgi:hypothetical protein
MGAPSPPAGAASVWEDRDRRRADTSREGWRATSLEPPHAALLLLLLAVLLLLLVMLLVLQVFLRPRIGCCVQPRPALAQIRPSACLVTRCQRQCCARTRCCACPVLLRRGMARAVGWLGCGDCSLAHAANVRQNRLSLCSIGTRALTNRLG